MTEKILKQTNQLKKLLIKSIRFFYYILYIYIYLFVMQLFLYWTNYLSLFFANKMMTLFILFAASFFFF